MSAVETRCVRVQIRPPDIVRLRVIIESYEGLGRCTTLDDTSTIVQIAYLSDQESDMLTLLQALETEGWLTITTKPAPLC